LSDLIPVAEALERLFALRRPPVPETVPLTRAAGRVLLEPVRARRAQPPFDASAMDGYALRSADAAPGARLRVVGEAAAGRALGRVLGPGEAARILTGAPLPEGADAVVMQEDVAREGDAVVLGNGARPGHVRRAGADFAAGATLSAPRRLSPADVMLAAAMGHATLDVARRPDVAILSTGDELAVPGEEVGPDQVFAANAYGLHALLSAAGARARVLPIARDTTEDLADAFALAEGCDLLVTIGGASVGDHDLMAPAARAAGADLAFHRVAMRPGKPILAGRLGGGVLLGLPGNPVSALVTAQVFAVPLLLAMQGLPPAPAPRTRATLAAPLPAGSAREHYLRAARLPDGRVRPFERQDSSLLTVMADADCLVVQPPSGPALLEGEVVDVVDLR
jgi:molybdopterin molybdotransferase